jgi:hypothetical protein
MKTEEISGDRFYQVFKNRPIKYEILKNLEIIFFKKLESI